jgi:hypothetical protein
MLSDIRIYKLNLFFWISYLFLSIGDGAAIGSNYIGRSIFYFHYFQLSILFGRDEMASVIVLLNYISDGHAIPNHVVDISEAPIAAGIGVDSIDYL